MSAVAEPVAGVPADQENKSGTQPQTASAAPAKPKSKVQEALDGLPSRGGDGVPSEDIEKQQKKGGKKKRESTQNNPPKEPKKQPATQQEAVALKAEYAEKWAGRATESVPLANIVVVDRYREKTDTKEDLELRKSINDFGLLQPLAVEKGSYRLIAGGRRLEQCKALGLTVVPCYMIDPSTEADWEIRVLEMEVEENVQRSNPSLGERLARARKIEELYKRAGKTPAGGVLLRDRVAKSVGISHETRRQAEIVVKAAENNPKKFGELATRMKKDDITAKAAYHQVLRLMGDEVDGIGVPIHERVKPAFIRASEFDSAIKHLDTTINTVSSICNEAGGERLYDTSKFETKDVTDSAGVVKTINRSLALTEVVEMLKNAKPFCQCPICFEKAGMKLGIKTTGTKCPACHGSLHISEKTWQNLAASQSPGVAALKKLADECRLQAEEAAQKVDSNAKPADATAEPPKGAATTKAKVNPPTK